MKVVREFKYLGIHVNARGDASGIMQHLEKKMDIKHVIQKMYNWSMENKLKVFNMKIMSGIRFSLQYGGYVKYDRDKIIKMMTSLLLKLFPHFQMMKEWDIC